MITMNCPSCNVPTVVESGLCDVCGAYISQGEGNSGVSDSSSVTDSASREAPTGDELLDALRAKILSGEHPPPKEWVERFEQLAWSMEPGERLATYCFVDLSGYSILTRELSPESHRRLMAKFHDICQGETFKHRGFVISTAGDCVKSGFGAPWSFGRDSESAGDYLLAVKKRMIDWGEFEGHRIAFTAGAAVGVADFRMQAEGVVRERPDPHGDAVNLTARLQQGGSKNCIHVSSQLAELLSSQFELRPIDSLDPKNFEKGVVRFELMGRLAQPLPRRRGDLELVGRGDQLSVLCSDVDAALSGEFRCRSVLGEPGIGKSRLVEESLKSYHGLTELRIVRVTLEPGDALRLGRAVEVMMRAMAGSTRSETPRAVLDALCERAPSLDKTWHVPLGWLVGERDRQLPDAKDPRRLQLGAFRHLLESYLLEGPLVLVLDDWQWSDQLSAELLSASLTIPIGGLCVMIAARPGEEGSRGKFESDSEPLASSLPGLPITLSSLDREECKALIENTIRGKSLSLQVRNAIFSAAGGNPHVLIELAHAVTKMPAKSNLELPTTLQLEELLQSRADQLGPSARAVLNRASVLGTKFPRSRLVRFCDDLADGKDAIAALVVERVLIPDEENLEFSLPAMSLLLNKRLAAEDRRDLNARAASLIEAEPEALNSYELAWHWLASDQPDRAALHIRRAAIRAIYMGASREALTMLARALAEPGGKSPILRATLLDLAARAARMMEDPTLALEFLSELEELALRLGNSVTLSNARSEMARCWSEQGQYAKAAELLEAILSAECAASGAEARMVTVRLRLGAVYLEDGSGRTAEALTLFDEAAKRAQRILPNHAAAGEARNSAAVALLGLGRYEESLAASEDAKHIYEAAGYVPGLAQAWNNQGIALEKLGKLRSARKALNMALEIADGIGYTRILGAAHINLGDLCLLIGEFEQARTHGESAVKAARMLGRLATEANGLLVQALAAEGQTDDSCTVRLLKKALEKCKDPSCAGVRPYVAMDCAWLEMQLGNTVEAAALLKESPASIRTADLDSFRETTELGIAALRAGRAESGFAPEDLEVIMSTHGLTCAIRRARTALRLAQRGITNIEKSKIESQLRKWIANIES